MRRGFGQEETAVSDVVGTVLLLGITVTAFSILSIAVLDQFDRNPPPARIEFRVDTVGPRTAITAVWGESIEVADTKLIYEVNNARTINDLGVAPLSTHLNHRIPSSFDTWDVGETLRLGCPIGETCAHPGQLVTNVSVISKISNSVLFSSEAGVSRGSVLNPVADVVITIERVSDPGLTPAHPLYAGGAIEAEVKVRNGGVLPVPTDRQLVVSFFLDGSPTPFHTMSQTGGLIPGASFTTTTPTFTASTADHVIRATVSATPSVIEAGYGNNDVTRTFTVVPGVADPGAPFEDGNADVLYNPYTTSDALLTAASVTDGIHTAAASKGLVVPASVGTISAPGSVSFSAPSGRLTIRTSVETGSTSGSTMTLNGATGVNITGTFDLKSRAAILITSNGQIDLSGIRLDTNSADITVTSSANRVLAPGTSFYIAGVGTLPDAIRITSGGNGAIHLAGARFDSAALIRIAPSGSLYSQNAILKAAATITYNLANPDSVYAAGSTIDDADDCADVDPSSIPIIGVPASGRVQTTC